MSNTSGFAFGKINYIIMLVGLVTLVVGFIIMSADSEPYGFGFLGLTLGPIVVFLGFMVQFVAILYKPKTSDNKKLDE
ncbi:MAG: putative membrane protein [Cyclobacteriaceae bacterium]|jgi:uncharacterized membrane protein